MVRPRNSLAPTDTAALSNAMAGIFMECQKSLSTQRKNVAQMRKLLEKCGDPVTETCFVESFLNNLNKALPVKKGAAVADRVIKFVAAFVHFTLERDRAALPEVESDEEEEVEETMSTRFVDTLLQHLLKGTSAKDKHVRMRVVQLLSESISALQNIDVDLYNDLKVKLFERLREKDAAVRGQAVKAIAGLQLTDDLEDEEGKSVEVVMVEMLQLDPSAEVRKAVAETLGATEYTQARLVERARDTDVGIRKAFYSKNLEQEGMQLQQLSLEQRERILTWGLNDRDAGVRKACTKMLCENWIRKSSNGNIVEFLTHLDILGNGKAAEDSVKAFLSVHNNFVPPTETEVWENLLPETAFLLRVYCQHCAEQGNQDALEDLLPEVSKHVTLLQQYYGHVLEAEEAMESEDEVEDRKLAYDYILGQLLLIASHLDYADEVGRRKMFAYLRELVGSFSVDELHVPAIVDVMRSISVNSKDFSRVMVEIMTDLLQETGVNGPPRTPRKMTPQESQEQHYTKMFAMMRCLQIVRCMLTKTEGNLADMPSMDGLLNDLVIRAIKINDAEFAAVKSLGMHCLGLYCTMDKTLAQENMRVFIHAFCNSDHDELQVVAVKTIFDLVMLWGLPTFQAEQGVDIIRIFKRCLEHESGDVVTTAVEGVAKLFILRFITDEELLQALIVLYFHPLTADNPRVRQCLNVFFEAFSHSAFANKKLMARVFTPALINLSKIQASLSAADSAKMTPLLQMGQQMLDWTDVRRLVKPEDGVDEALHVQVFTLLTESTFVQRSTAKVFSQWLSRAHFVKTESLPALIAALDEVRKYSSDATATNAFKKCVNSLSQMYTGGVVEGVPRRTRTQAVHQVNYEEEGEQDDEHDEEYEVDDEADE